MSPSGTGTIGTSSLTADTIEQTSTGTYQVDLTMASDATDSVADLLDIENSASVTLDGTVTPNAVGANSVVSGDSGSVEILTGSDLSSFTTSNLSVVDSGVVDYSLTSSGDDLYLNYAIDFTASATASPLTGNARTFGEHLGGGLISTVETELVDGSVEKTAFEEFVNAVLNAPRDKLESLYGEQILDEAAAGVVSAISSTLSLHDLMHSCPQLDRLPTTDFYRQQECVWTRGIGESVRQNETPTNPGYSEAIDGIAVGTQKEIGDDLFVELAGLREGFSISGANFTQDGRRLGAGATLKKEAGMFTFSGTLSGGFYSYDYSRNYSVGSDVFTANSSPSGQFLGGEARLEALFADAHDGFYVKPGIAIAATQTWQGAFTETGAGFLDQHVDAVSQSHVALRPAVEVGGSFDLNGMTAAAYLRGGLTAFLTNPDVNVTATYADLGVALPGMTATLSQDRLYGEIEAGANFLVNDRTSLGIAATTTFSGNTWSIGGQGRLQVRF
jgi:Autotransporter beta-domain